MRKNNLNYISKEDCIKRGLIRRKNGQYYKLNTLEKYAINGFLDGTRYDTTDLVAAGKRLYIDYYNADINRLSACDISKTKVCNDRNKTQSQAIVLAKVRYNKAIISLPREAWRIVTNVCCRDEELIIPESVWQKNHTKLYSLEMLKLGLCQLVDHYKKIDELKEASSK